MSDAAILMEIVLRSFVESDDFNGILLENAGELAGLSGDDLRLVTKALIDQAQVELSFEHHTGNPHIKRLPGPPPTEQIRAVLEDDLRGICIYPSAAKISKHTDITLYDDRPYSKRLLLAEAQLIPVFFDLCVLERYMEDPRYSYDFSGFGGHISIEGPESILRTQDQILIESFGIGYDLNRHRVVVVYLRYLHKLTAEHQQFWKSYQVSASECKINSDIERSAVLGAWPTNHSAYEALLYEQAEINNLSGLMGRPGLFKKTFENDRPRLFCPMLRPTGSSLDKFVHLLDKMRLKT